jgi:iron(III) transport system ATP-binding protein
MSAAVAIEGVSFAYGATPVLADVSLTVAPGEFFAFLGPSGSGKTTLLRLIAGFGTPASGRIRISERDVTLVPPWERNLGMVFQSYALWPHMTVAENVAFGLEQRRRPREEIRRRVAAALDMVGLAALAARRPAQLSGGQQQRVALARTLVVEPAVLLLDEPLSNLDAKLRVEMRAELVSLQRRSGITTIYVTHDQEEANATADRIALLDRGRIQQIGGPMELYDRPANRFVATFLGTVNLIEGTVEASEAGVVFRADGLAVPLPRAERPGRASLALRPQSLRLVEADGFAGMVVGREFLGSVLRYRVAVGTHRLTVEEPNRRGVREIALGASIRLAFDPQEATILRD